jgi:spore maturation protein SpmA
VTPGESSRVRDFVVSVGRESLKLFLDLLKVMVPVMIAVRLAQQFGGIGLASRLLEPLMSIVGLPPEMGIVWATGALVGTYAGIGAFLELHGAVDLTVAQATVIGSMILTAHSLPLEGGIIRKAGPSFLVTGLLRVGAALVYGWILTRVYAAGDWLQEPLRIAWLPAATAQPGWLEWAGNSVLSIGIFFAIITALIVLLRLLDAIGFNRVLARLLAPFLGIMKIDDSATGVTMIGVLLGLAFGGGLIINEARRGRMQPRTIFLALTLLGLFHSVIEEPLVFMTIGADLSGTLIGRIIFAVLVMAVLGRVVMALPDRIFYRLLFSGQGKYGVGKPAGAQERP